VRIVFVVNGLGTGGAERSLVEMTHHFVDAGVEPTFVCFYRRDEGVEASAIRAGWDVRFVHDRGLLRRVWALAQIVREVRPHLVHSSIFEADLVARVTRLIEGTPLVCSLVNMPYERLRTEEDIHVTPQRLQMVRYVDAFTSHAFVTHFHAITQAVKESATRQLGIAPRRITVVHRGRDRARLGDPSAERRASARRALGLTDDRPVVLNVARHEFQKGQRHLVSAWDSVHRRDPGAVLLIAGRNGNATEALRADVARLGLESSVRFLGHRDDVPELLCAADIFCLPSLWEGLGGVLLEAMALGVPIVASRLPPTEEVLVPGGGASLVEPADAQALGRALDALLVDPARRRAMSDVNARHFRENFDLPVISERMLDVFRRHARSVA
jgi:glycosyltransferase involved in cell wall biosynthesis